MSDCKHDPHIYGGSGGGDWHTGVTFTELGYEDKDNKGKVFWECGEPMHLSHQ